MMLRVDTFILLASLSLFNCGPAPNHSTSSPNNKFGINLETISTAQKNDAFAEKTYTPNYIGLATATANNTNLNRHPWPVHVQSIGHNTASYQNYGGEPYFHHGLDIRADAGSDVIASVGGRIV
ncbi:MAG: hypothetical protein EBX41_10995, partial [Chitinophagia bacterium]|nr:hypothetical protein [Chitinophagia bacterium]